MNNFVSKLWLFIISLLYLDLFFLYMVKIVINFSLFIYFKLFYELSFRAYVSFSINIILLLFWLFIDISVWTFMWILYWNIFIGFLSFIRTSRYVISSLLMRKRFLILWGTLFFKAYELLGCFGLKLFFNFGLFRFFW